MLDVKDNCKNTLTISWSSNFFFFYEKYLLPKETEESPIDNLLLLDFQVQLKT